MRTHRTSSKQKDIRDRMSAAGFSSEQLADDDLIECVSRLLRNAVPQPPSWYSGDGRTNAAEIGEYGVLDAETATVVWDDRKFAECYSNDDASWLAGLLKVLYPGN